MHMIPDPPAITANGVHVEIGGETILEGTSFSAGDAERIAILGASGCGKTTLLRVVGGLVKPSAGTIASGFKRPGFVFQDPRLLPWRSALDNAALGLGGLDAPSAQRREHAAVMLIRCGLSTDDLGKFPSQLSGGMRARVALARALLHDPDLLLFDEPFGSLDIGTRNALQKLLYDRVRDNGMTMLLVTHDLREAVNLCSRVLVMSRKGGTIVADVAVPPSANVHSDWGHSASTHELVTMLLANEAVRKALFIG